METGFGWIRIDGHEYRSDLVLVDLGDGLIRVKERDKSHAEIRYGTSHVIDWVEISRYLADWPEVDFDHFFVGTGQYGRAELDPAARAKLEKLGMKVHVHPTPEALKKWERTSGKKIGVFHATC